MGARCGVMPGAGFSGAGAKIHLKQARQEPRSCHCPCARTEIAGSALFCGDSLFLARRERLTQYAVDDFLSHWVLYVLWSIWQDGDREQSTSLHAINVGTLG